MKKYIKNTVKILSVLLILIIGFSLIAELQYDISPLEYLQYSMPLTPAENNYLQEKDAIVYGLDWKAPPLTFVNEETGQIEGLLVDYMSSLSIELGVSISYDATRFSNIMDRLDQGITDMSDLFESPERLKKYAFTQPLYRLRGIAVTTADRPDLRENSDYTNEEVLKIVLINLINNGAEALMADGTAARGSSCILSCTIAARDAELIITVADNGPRIPERQQESIFNPFFTTKDTRTGLDLYLVSSELEKLGGSIQVESRIGEGTVLTV